MEQKLIEYLHKQIRTMDDRLNRFIMKSDGTAFPKRFAFNRLQSYVSDFLEKKVTSNMVIIPGFRGVGKTTLMSQICAEYKSVVACLFVSVEDVRNLFGVGIAELIAAYEDVLGTDIEQLETPILMFLDEVQADPKWCLTLKSLYERTKNIFFCCSGSAAVILQTTPNLARRAVFEKLPPMSFSEYQITKNNITPPDAISEKINAAIYLAGSVKESYQILSGLQNQVNQYWMEIDKRDIKTYLSYGSLPFSLTHKNETLIYDAILSLVDKVIATDLPLLESFDNTTLNIIKRILFVVAENDITSLAKLEEVFKISRHTISSILSALVKAEILIQVPSYGSNMSVAKKPSKYLFTSPAIRMSFFNFTGAENTYMVRQGKLLEDSIGASLFNEFIAKGRGAMRYDSEEGGADFILQILNNRQLIIEVGLGAKGSKQIRTTSKKVASKYNIIFSDTKLAIDDDANTLYVPLDYYFLV